MRARASRLRVLIAVATIVPAVIGIGSMAATAQATCVFDEPTGVVTIVLAADQPATVVRSGDAIAVDGQACGTATVSNTDLVLVSGGGAGEVFTIDLSGGQFAPGLTAETDGGNSEIEFLVTLGTEATLRVAGGTGDDAITAGTAGINLNATEAPGDVDVAISGLPAIELLGAEGADVLSIAGGGATGDGIADVLVDGGAGDDRLVGRLGGSTLTGGDGTDTLDYSAAAAINANLATGVVGPSEAFVDQVASAENLIATPGNDILVGDGNANSILAGDGDDQIDGGPGDDELNGGAGIDSVSYASSKKAVTVDLVNGTADGDGADALSGIENVEGSGKSDDLTGNDLPNDIRGGGGRDTIRGRAKADLVIGNKGNDRLFGGDGRDTLDGGAGRDQLDGGKSKDTCIPGKDPDAWTSCETVKL
jgi:Ca2+-binding RTX toxin-like protein